MLFSFQLCDFNHLRACAVRLQAKCLYNTSMAKQENQLSHIDESGRAHMVNVAAKPETERIAVARGEVALKPETVALIRQGLMKKGDVLTVAQIAGIAAAKRTSELIPL